MFPVAHANDGGGSIRIPASCCGLVGLKPSRGRTPRLSQSWLGAVVEGVVTRTVADSAAILDAISSFDPYAWYNAPPPARPFAAEVGADAGRLRVGLMEGGPGGMPVDPACSEAARKAARALEELGHSVEPAEVATVSEELMEPFILLVYGSHGEAIGEVDFTKVEPHIAAEFEQGRALPTVNYVAAVKGLERLSRRLMAPWRRDFDVLITPTMGVPPPPAGAIMEMVHENPGQPAELVIAMVAFTAFANVTGLPAISLPLHESDGVPIGAQLIGSPFDEATLIRLASALERVVPWADRRPAIVAPGAQTPVTTP
jgi:amidase